MCILTSCFVFVHVFDGTYLHQKHGNKLTSSPGHVTWALYGCLSPHTRCNANKYLTLIFFHRIVKSYWVVSLTHNFSLDFWSKFTKIFVPIFILLLIGVIVLLYMRRQRIRREVKRITEVEGKRCVS